MIDISDGNGSDLGNSIEVECPYCDYRNYVDNDDWPFTEEGIYYPVKCFKCSNIFKFETIHSTDYYVECIPRITPVITRK